METQNIEYKESWRDEYLKWICGFANAQGGTLYVGINDKGDVVGVDDAKRLLEDIPNKVRHALGLMVDVQLLEENGKNYLQIDVEASSYPINYRGEYHIRSGATKQVLQGPALTHFLLKRTGLKWDAIPVDNFTYTDLDIESFNIFRREALRSKRMTKEDLDCSNEELLDKLNLMVDGKLKRAAVLLFHRDPEKMITGCYTKIGMFNKDADILYMDEVHGSLMIQADRVLDLLYQKYLKAYITYEKFTRVETYPFPKSAVREAIYNALVHSDWSASCPIQIRVEDDVLYISNNCVLADGWTAETFLASHKSLQLNPDIANTFFRAGYIEAWGRGIEKMCKACREYEAPEPVYLVHPHDLMLRFDAAPAVLSFIEDERRKYEWSRIPRNAEVTEKVASKVASKVVRKVTGKAADILREMAKNPNVTIAELTRIISMSNAGVRKIIGQMKSDGLIRRIGPDKGGHWEVIDSQQ